MAQKNVDLEYLLMDGGSTDGTLDIIKEYAEKNSCVQWVSERDKGYYDAVNKGILTAAGDVIGILNSDDRYYKDDVLETVVKEFENSKCEMVYGDILYLKNGSPYRYWKSGTQKPLRTGWMAPHPALFIQKKTYEKYGLYRLDCPLNGDYELMVRYFEKYKLNAVYIKKLFVLMNAGGMSNSGIKSRLNTASAFSYVWYVNGLKVSAVTRLLKYFIKILQYFFAKTYKLWSE